MVSNPEPSTHSRIQRPSAICVWICAITVGSTVARNGWMPCGPPTAASASRSAAPTNAVSWHVRTGSASYTALRRPCSGEPSAVSRKYDSGGRSCSQ